jgi:hypothetical protein
MKNLKPWQDKKGRFKKGVPSWLKGKRGLTGYWTGKKRPPLSDETKRKIGKASKGRIVSAETKLKISNAHKGMKKPWAKPPIKKGKDNNLWKGGNSRNYKTGYYSSKYKEWRLKIFIRDNFTCQGCEKVGGYLTAHHIKSFAHYPELRFEIDNGITLCEECHKKTDNYKGRNKGKRLLEGTNLARFGA